MRGMPVVTTDIAGIPEMFEHGTHGFCFPPDDMAPFVGALEQIGGASAECQRRRLQMGAAARKHAIETFTNAIMVSQYRAAALQLSPPIILIDMDGCLVDWDAGFEAKWKGRSPIIRFGRYLQAQGWYDGQQEEELRKQARKDAIRSLNSAQRVGKPHSMHLFSDVYDEVPWNLEEQEQALLEHMQKYPSSYIEHIESNAKELERAGAVTSP